MKLSLIEVETLDEAQVWVPDRDEDGLRAGIPYGLYYDMVEDELVIFDDLHRNSTAYMWVPGKCYRIRRPYDEELPT